MFTCLITISILVKSTWHPLLGLLPLERGSYWLLLLVFSSFSFFLLWRKSRGRFKTYNAAQTLQAWQQTSTNQNATKKEKAVVAEAVSAHWQDLDKQLLQLKTQLEAKNKVFDHLMQHLLPKALEVDSLKVPAQELFELVKGVQITTHFSDQTLTGLPTDFEQRLLSHHPALTEEELRLCAYLYLHLSSLQIANLKAISVAGVNKARLRLRKKLGLSSEMDLFVYLNQLQTTERNENHA